MRIDFVVGFFFVLGTLGVAMAADLQLVKDGKSPYVIVLRASASPSEKRGAAEIQKHLKEMSGAELAIGPETTPPAENEIVIGIGQRAKDANIAADEKALGPEGFTLKTAGNKLYVLGSPVRGAMYGCSDVLEKIGVRWFTPKVTRIPKAKDISLPALDETQTPAFEYREPYFTEAWDKDWSARNRLVGSSFRLDESTGGKITYADFVHSFDRLIPQDLYARHPDYFPMVGGKRINGYVQRCLSNPEVLKIAVAGVREAFKKHPEAIITSVSQNDVDKWCECPDCARLAKQYGGQSGVYVWFVNQVAEQIEKDYPDKLIDTLAYQFTEAPPTGIKPRANVRIRLCPISCCESHPYQQCTADANKAFIKRLNGWSAITDTLYIWHYNTDFGHYLMPFPDFKEFPADTKMYKQHGVKGIFFQGAYSAGGGGSDAELRSYVMSKVLWNVDADSDAAVTEWMEGVYGPAARPMRQWFDLLHAQFKAPDAHLFIYEAPRIERFTKDVMDQGAKLFDEADQLAQTELQREYLKKSRLWMRYVDLIHHPDTDQKLKAFIADCKSFGITELNEGRNIDQWERDFVKQWKPKT